MDNQKEREALRQQIAEDIKNFKGEIQVIPYLGDPQSKPRIEVKFISVSMDYKDSYSEV